MIRPSRRVALTLCLGAATSAAGLEAQHIAADAFHPAAPAGLGLLERLRRLSSATSGGTPSSSFAFTE